MRQSKEKILFLVCFPPSFSNIRVVDKNLICLGVCRQRAFSARNTSRIWSERNVSTPQLCYCPEFILFQGSAAFGTFLYVSSNLVQIILYTFIICSFLLVFLLTLTCRHWYKLKSLLNLQLHWNHILSHRSTKWPLNQFYFTVNSTETNVQVVQSDDVIRTTLVSTQYVINDQAPRIQRIR